MSKESIADRYRSDGPVDLDEQEEHSSTADRWRRSDGPVDLDEHEQEQYTSSFRLVPSHNSIVSGNNHNMSLPHCCAIAATNNNTSNFSFNNINGTINGKNKVQSNNSAIIDSFPRLQSMLDEPMNGKLRDWARRHQNIIISSSINRIPVITPILGTDFRVIFLRGCISLKNWSYRPLLRDSTSLFKRTCLLIRVKEDPFGLYCRNGQC
jgi:hypothetical protein